MIVAADYWSGTGRFTTLVQIAVAIGTLGAALAAALAVRAANGTTAAANRQAKASQAAAERAKDSVDAALEELKLVESQIELGRRQLEASRALLQASMKPLLAELPFEEYRDSHPVGFGAPGDPYASMTSWAVVEPGTEIAKVGIRVRNVGSGPALLSDVQLHIGSAHMYGRSDQTVIPVGGRALLTLVVPSDAVGYGGCRSSILTGAEVSITVVYTDLAGGQITDTRFRLLRVPGDQYEVHKTYYRPLGGSEADAVSATRG